MLPDSPLDDDVFGFASVLTRGVVKKHRAKPQLIAHRPQSSGKIHCPMVVECQASLLRKEQKSTHRFVDERVVQDYPTDIGMPYRTTRPRQPTAPQPAQHSTERKQITLCSIRTKSGGLP